MRLQDLRQRLYSKQSDIESRKPQTDVYDPRSKEAEVPGTSGQETSENKDWKIETGTTQKQKTLLVLVASVLAGIIVLGGGGYIVYRVFKKDFKQQQVQLQINVPLAVNLNDEVALSIPFANNNPVGLKDAHLVISVPPNFLIASTNPQADSTGTGTAEWSLGDIAAMEELTFRGLAEHPEMLPIYEKLLYERNITMASKIEGFLKEGGTRFVVIGSGHLLGSKGILKLLERKGYIAEQL